VLTGPVGGSGDQPLLDGEHLGVDQRRSSTARSATTLTARSARNRSASPSRSVRVAPVRPAPRATRTSWRPKVDAVAVNPSGPASRANSRPATVADTVHSRSRSAVRPVTRPIRLSASCPRPAASARHRSYKVSSASCSLAFLVAWTAHLTSLGVRTRPSATSRSMAWSIWSVCFENPQTRSSGIPFSSRLPWRSAAVHSTPSVRTSARW